MPRVMPLLSTVRRNDAASCAGGDAPNLASRCISVYGLQVEMVIERRGFTACKPEACVLSQPAYLHIENTTQAS